MEYWSTPTTVLRRVACLYDEVNVVRVAGLRGIGLRDTVTTARTGYSRLINTKTLEYLDSD